MHLPVHDVESLAVTILPVLYTALTVGLVYLLALALESSEAGAWLAVVTYDRACSRWCGILASGLLAVSGILLMLRAKLAGPTPRSDIKT